MFYLSKTFYHFFIGRQDRSEEESAREISQIKRKEKYALMADAWWTCFAPPLVERLAAAKECIFNSWCLTCQAELSPCFRVLLVKIGILRAVYVPGYVTKRVLQRKAFFSFVGVVSCPRSVGGAPLILLFRGCGTVRGACLYVLRFVFVAVVVFTSNPCSRTGTGWDTYLMPTWCDMHVRKRVRYH